MTKKVIVLLSILVFSTGAHAEDVKPSEASVRELLRVTESRQLLDSTMAQFDNIMKGGIEQAFKGQNLTAPEQKQIEDLRKKLIEVYKQDMNWESLEPIFIKVYRDSFTQQEVDGLTAFYRSPTGKAVIKKMPIVMQNTLGEMQKRMVSTMQKVMKIEQDSIAEMKAHNQKE